MRRFSLIAVAVAATVMAAVAPSQTAAQGFGDVQKFVAGVDANGTNAAAGTNSNGAGGSSSGSGAQSSGHWRWSTSQGGEGGQWVWENGEAATAQAPSLATVDEYWPLVLDWVKALAGTGALDSGALDLDRLRNMVSATSDQRVGYYRLNIASVAGYSPPLDEPVANASSSSTTVVVTALLSTLIAAALVAGTVIGVRRYKHKKDEDRRLDSLISSWASERKILPEYISFADLEYNEGKSTVVYEDDVVAMLATALVEEEELKREYAAWGISLDDEDTVEHL